MSLSCSCGDDYDWYYRDWSDYQPLNTSRRKRCVSCNKLINIGDLSISFDRYRPPRSDYEETRFGDEVPLADKYMCEECADIFFSLEELGFCINLGDSMRDLAREYNREYVSQPTIDKEI